MRQGLDEAALIEVRIVVEVGSVQRRTTRYARFPQHLLIPDVVADLRGYRRFKLRFQYRR
jgi:hypothetical protein